MSPTPAPTGKIYGVSLGPGGPELITVKGLRALQRADLILAETPELTRRLRHDLGFSPELVRTVPAADAASVAQALRTAHVRISGGAA